MFFSWKWIQQKNLYLIIKPGVNGLFFQTLNSISHFACTLVCKQKNVDKVKIVGNTRP